MSEARKGQTSLINNVRIWSDKSLEKPEVPGFQTNTEVQDALGDWIDQTAVNSLKACAHVANRQISIVTRPTTPDSQKILAKRRHDVKGALRTLGFVVQALEGGYRFDDDSAATKVQAIAKAIKIIEKEQDLLLKVLGA
jgi:hypothetical protein